MTKAWALTKLSEVLQPISRPERVDPTKEYRLLGIRLDGVGPFHRETIQGSQSAARFLYKVKTGDFIYSRLFACRGAFGVIGSDLDGCYVSGEFPTFVTIDDRVDVNFLKLWFCLPMTIRKVDSNCTGSTPLTRNRFKENFFLNLDIPLPPVTEQRWIVAKIEELAAKIHEAYTLRQEALKETEVLAGVFLKSAFDSRLGTGGWPSRLLPEIAEVARGKFGHRPRNEPRFYGGNIPFIQIGDISNAKGYIRSYSQTLNEQGLAISRLFPVGTVVIAITGATIGVTGILTFDSCFPDSIVGIQAKPEFATPEFIYFAVEYVKSAALAEATQTTQPNINLSNLERLKVPVPSISEQCRIVAQLNALQVEVDTLRHLQTETSDKLDALLPSILDKAFKGEL